MGTRIGLVGDYNEQVRAHRAIPKAVAAASGGEAECVWIATEDVGDPQALAAFDGLWCVPASPYRSFDGALRAIRYARMGKVPFLGTCGGFQHAVIEYARNVLGFSEADHAESAPGAAMPLIAPLACTLVGVKGRVLLLDGSAIRRIYGVAEAIEGFHCGFGINGRYRDLFEHGQLTVTAVDESNEPRAVELQGHPFFLATLFQPELRALDDPGAEVPVVRAFVEACGKRKPAR